MDVSLYLSRCMLLLAASLCAVSAQDHRTISLVVPFSAGSAQDTFARLISEPLGQELRARVLVGCKRVAQAFEAVRAAVLGRERDLDRLRAEVSEMRAKMRDNLGTRATAAGTAANAFEAAVWFDLKQDAGGIVDIEFMVQYAALAWSRHYPELLEFTDNIRILEGLERVGLLAAEDAGLLQEAYKAYRAAAHRQALQKQPGVVHGDQFQEQRRSVLRIWRELGLN